jgi:hypothetical protein
MFATATAAILSAIVLTAPAADEKPIDAKAAFERIKGLSGRWVSEGGNGHAASQEVKYRLTAAGSAVVETMFEGSDHEMVSVYHLDGDDLRMTHYCAAGNQPRLKLDRAASKPDDLVFVFDGGTNLDPAKDMHIHGCRFHFTEDGKVEARWSAYAGGKPLEDETAYTMKRP